MSWEVFKWYVLTYTSAPRRARNIYIWYLQLKPHACWYEPIQVQHPEFRFWWEQVLNWRIWFETLVRVKTLQRHSQLLLYRHLTRGLQYELLVDGRGVIIPPPTTLPNGSNPELIGRSSTGNWIWQPDKSLTCLPTRPQEDVRLPR